ncbi:MAG: hypothetical protein C4554_07530 [Dethiobacter sp.]|nr:MAG: hypothetical protein C4554_07530 [Dethiobacter sp.]
MEHIYIINRCKKTWNIRYYENYFCVTIKFKNEIANSCQEKIFFPLNFTLGAVSEFPMIRIIFKNRKRWCSEVGKV